MRALPYVSSGRPSEHIGQPLPALRSSQSSSQVRLIAAKTLAFREPCYRNGPGDDVVAEDGEGVSGSEALSLRVSDDAALLREAASEPARFAALYRLYVDDLYRYLLSRCGDAADAEDLVAETFLAAFRSARGYRGTGPVKAWLVGIARRKAADARRQSRPHVGLEEARPLIDPVRTDDPAVIVGADGAAASRARGRRNHRRRGPRRLARRRRRARQRERPPHASRARGSRCDQRVRQLPRDRCGPELDGRRRKAAGGARLVR